MHIIVFLHSHAETGEYLGYHEGHGDLFEVNSVPVDLINQELNMLIGDCIDDDVWQKVKDTAFRIELTFEDGMAIPESIDQMNNIYHA